MKMSESVSNLTKALVKAQAEMGAAVKGNKNPFFKSNYSDLPTIMEVVKEPLNNNGLLVLQPGITDGTLNYIETVIMHAESGEWVSSTTQVFCAKPNDSQAYGSAQTYARRFGLQAMLFVPSLDDDGNRASGNDSKQQYTAPAKPAYQAPVAKPGLSPQIQKAAEVQQQYIDAGLHKSPVSAPAALAPATQEVQPANGVAPLQKSSFRKTAAKVEAPAAAAPSESEWG